MIIPRPGIQAAIISAILACGAVFVQPAHAQTCAQSAPVLAPSRAIDSENVGSPDGAVNNSTQPMGQMAMPAVVAGSNSKVLSSQISEAIQLLSSNRNEQAATLLKRTVQSYPNSAEAHHTLGLALAKMGDSDQAVRELELARTLDPTMHSTWLTLAGLHQSLGHIDQAISLYDAFLNNADFKKRADLADSRTTVKTLLDSLKKEQQGMVAAEGEAHALNQPLRSALLQPPAQTANDDYVDEAVRVGVMTWPQVRMPIKVYIANAERVAGYRSRWREILVRSLDDWSAASGGLVRFQQVQRREDANIDCYFVSDDARLPSNSMDSDAEAGEAKMFMDKDGLSSGTIKILTKSISTVLPLTDNRIRVICLHEIGHALGLAGHTKNPQDIMFYSTSFKDEWKELSGRDARTIQRLYSQR
jgi:predicted Zn-dependent protease